MGQRACLIAIEPANTPGKENPMSTADGKELIWTRKYPELGTDAVPIEPCCSPAYFWKGFIFINLDSNSSETLMEYLGEVAEQLERRTATVLLQLDARS